MTFTDKRVLVTGSTRGIGRGTVEAFLARGARVAVNGRTAQSIDSAVGELEGSGTVVAAPGDVSTVAGCEAAVAAAVDGLGGLDILVNSAGIYAIRSILDTDEALWDRMNDINVKGTYFTIRAAIPALKEAGGCVVNVGSTAGLAGSAMSTVYCATKGAVVNLTRAVALELAPDVRVNCICPGVVDTEMGLQNIELVDDPSRGMDAMASWYPLGRVATVKEVANSILYLCSEDAGFMTGGMLALDGGALAADSG